MTKLKIALIQMEIKERNKAGNIEHGLELVRQAASACDVAVLPEIWTTGYSLGRIKEEAERPDGPVIKRLSALAAEYSCSLVAGSVPLYHNGRVQNTALVFDRSGKLIYTYSKLHLFGMFNENRFFEQGEGYAPFSLDGVPGGVTICYDLRFPELYRGLALKGAQIIFVPAEWPVRRGEIWRLLLQARAAENQVFICGVNSVGSFKDDVFFGHSMLVAPTGDILAEADGEERIIIQEIDLQAVSDSRRHLEALSDVRKDIFSFE